jgi:hypothetical protein
MACPGCGGVERVELAPGFFECRSPVAADHLWLGPAGTGQVCGRRYQDGPMDATVGCIFCGLSAFARCTGCVDPVCGVHMRLGPDGIECSRCYQRRVDSAAPPSF